MEYVGGSKFRSARGRCVALHSGYGFHFLCRCCLEAIVVVIFFVFWREWCFCELEMCRVVVLLPIIVLATVLIQLSHLFVKQIRVEIFGSASFCCRMLAAAGLVI